MLSTSSLGQPSQNLPNALGVTGKARLLAAGVLALILSLVLGFALWDLVFEPSSLTASGGGVAFLVVLTPLAAISAWNLWGAYQTLSYGPKALDLERDRLIARFDSARGLAAGTVVVARDQVRPRPLPIGKGRFRAQVVDIDPGPATGGLDRLVVTAANAQALREWARPSPNASAFPLAPLAGMGGPPRISALSLVLHPVITWFLSFVAAGTLIGFVIAVALLSPRAVSMDLTCATPGVSPLLVTEKFPEGGTVDLHWAAPADLPPVTIGWSFSGQGTPSTGSGSASGHAGNLTLQVPDYSQGEATPLYSFACLTQDGGPVSVQLSGEAILGSGI